VRLPTTRCPHRTRRRTLWHRNHNISKLTATTFPTTTNYSHNTSNDCKIQPHHFQRLPTKATAPTTTTPKSTTLCTNNNNTNVNNCVGTTTIHAWYRRPVHLRHHFDWVFTTPTPPQTGLRYTHRAANHGTANGFHYDQIYGPAPRPRRRTLHVRHIDISKPQITSPSLWRKARKEAVASAHNTAA